MFSYFIRSIIWAIWKNFTNASRKPSNILLVNLPYVSYSSLDDAFTSAEAAAEPILLDIPLGLLYLASYARKYAERNFNIKLLDINKEILDIINTRKLKGVRLMHS